MIKIGNYIRLKNKSFQELYLKNEEWLDNYMNTNQFEYVSLWFENLNCRGEYAKMIFDSSISKVIEIKNDKNEKPLLVRTEHFWIVYPDALEKNEIELLNEIPKKIIGFENDKKMINDIEFFEIEYKKGLFDVLERENNKYDSYKRGFYFMKSSGKWKHITAPKPH